MGIPRVAIALLLIASLAASKELPPEQNDETGHNGKRMAMRSYDEMVEMLTVDEDNEREVIEIRNETTGSTNIAVFDFRRSIASAYIEEIQECFLVGGLDGRLPTPEDTLAAWEEIQMDGPVGPDEEGTLWLDVVYTPTDDFPSANAELVAEEIRDYCADKQVTWLERKHQETGKTRNRRQVDLRANGGGSVGSRGSIFDGDLHLDYTRRSGRTSHTLGGSAGATHINPRGYPSMTDPRWEARYGITRHGRRSNWGADFHVGGGRGGASRGGVRFRIEF